MSRTIMPQVIGLTGGIGSGKSVVGKMAEALGHTLYDSDSSAKRIMNDDPILRTALIELLGKETYTTSGQLDRAYVAQRIFSEPALRSKVNAVVHPAVFRDIDRAIAASAHPLFFIESALLFESHLDHICHHTIAVCAPLELRIHRIIHRDHCTKRQAVARIEAQRDPDEIARLASYRLTNDDSTPLVAQLSTIIHDILRQ